MLFAPQLVAAGALSPCGPDGGVASLQGDRSAVEPRPTHLHRHLLTAAGAQFPLQVPRQILWVTESVGIMQVSRW